MAQYKIRDPDELVQCPFEKTHMIRASRMPYHIMKCKKNVRGEQFEMCPFNACHYVRKKELQQHIATCADAVRIENDIIFSQNEDSQFHGNCSVPDYTNSLPVATDGEDWDAECDNSRGVFMLGQVTAEEYFSKMTNARSETNQPRLPNSIPRALQAQSNKLPCQPVGRGRGFGRGLIQNRAAVGLDNRQNPGGGNSRDQVASIWVDRQNAADVAPGQTPTTAAVSNEKRSASSHSGVQHSPSETVKGHCEQNPCQPVSSEGYQGSKHTALKSTCPPPGLRQGTVSSSLNGDLEQHATPRVGDDSSCTVASADTRKQIRKCRKKLREIEALEEKRSGGAVLNSSEQAKIDSKIDLLEQLNKLLITEP